MELRTLRLEVDHGEQVFPLLLHGGDELCEAVIVLEQATLVLGLNKLVLFQQKLNDGNILSDAKLKRNQNVLTSRSLRVSSSFTTCWRSD